MYLTKEFNFLYTLETHYIGEKMNIAVTAASGGLGSAKIMQLLEQMPKEQVIGLARTPKMAENLGVEIRNGDYNNKHELIELLSGVDAVLLVSGMDAPDKRILQHQNVINAAKEAGYYHRPV